jgi:hypothetical protein
MLEDAPKRYFSPEQTRGEEAWAGIEQRKRDALAALQGNAGNAAGAGSAAGVDAGAPGVPEVEVSEDVLDLADQLAGVAVAELPPQ